MITKQKLILSYFDLIVTFISSSLTSLVLSFTLNCGKYIIPFYVYGAIVIINIILLYKKKNAFEYIVVFKVICDLLFATYWSSLYMYIVKDTQFFFLPAVILLIYGRFNLFSFKEKIIELALLVYLIVNGLLPVFFLGIERISLVGICIYIGSCSYAIWLYRKSLKYEISLEQTTQNIVNKFVRHDLNNILEVLSFIKNYENIPEKSKHLIIHAFHGLTNIRKILSNDNQPILFNPEKIIKLFDQKNIMCNISQDMEIVYSIPLFISIVQNIYSNSSEYASSMNIEFKMRIYNIDGETLCLEDTCGGKLNIREIQAKKSSKVGSDHGEFLNSLFLNASVLNVDTKYENYKEGVRIYIKFPTLNTKRILNG